jgi:hypothetical protein
LGVGIPRKYPHLLDGEWLRCYAARGVAQAEAFANSARGAVS